MSISSKKARKVRKEQQFPCVVGTNVVGSNSILYQLCKFQVSASQEINTAEESSDKELDGYLVDTTGA